MEKSFSSPSSNENEDELVEKHGGKRGSGSSEKALRTTLLAVLFQVSSPVKTDIGRILLDNYLSMVRASAQYTNTSNSS